MKSIANKGRGAFIQGWGVRPVRYARYGVTQLSSMVDCRFSALRIAYQNFDIKWHLVLHIAN